MSDYIKREDATEKINNALKRVFVEDVGQEIIASIPSADVVEVVRCKDCKNWTEWENGAGSCQRSDSVMWIGTDFNDFCSFAERKDNETI